ncbi:MAG TPA: hypothetical protein VL092_09815 [Chitinophagaceae bacterium]|nr:hypothetical protein [Chitinophagaceae bacterium]
MKRSVIILAAVTLSSGVFAQKSKVYSAKEYMEDNDMKKAVQAIDEAVNNESTKNDGDAWFTRGQIYEKLAATDPSATAESARSYLKVLEVKPNYDKAMIDDKLLRVAYKSYNEGAAAFSGDAAKNVKPDYDAAISAFQQVVSVREIDGGKHFAENKRFDTIAAQALKFQALAASQANKPDLALTYLNKAKASNIARDPYIYSTLIDIYTEKNDPAAVEKTLNEAKTLFPSNAEISRQEMNYYSRAGKKEILIQKMEEAAKADPNNSLLQYNLGVLYSSLANPQEADGKPGKKPANSKDLEAKAEMAYKMAIDGDPNKAEYVYNLGALYFNNAADITNQMNAISGTTDADNKKYDALKALRLTQFTKGLEYFQKSYNLLKPKSDKLSAEDASTYRDTLLALKTIYYALGQTEKGDDIKKEETAFNSK